MSSRHPGVGAEKRRFVPVPLGKAVQSGARRSMGRRGFGLGRLLVDWADIVGADLAALGTPEALKRSGGKSAKTAEVTLVLAVTGAQGPALDMAIPQIIARINAHFGYPAISAIRLIQGSRKALGSDIWPKPLPWQNQAQASPNPPARRPAAATEMSESLADIDDDTLRATLARLGQALATRRGN